MESRQRRARGRRARQTPPLHQGEEIARRYRAWHEQADQWAATSHSRFEAALALVEAAEKLHQERHAERQQAPTRRYATV
ncbi:hypothetical protein GCM10022226_78710 [Sphaerisporangium flaviroseum]|uniref:Uncharacterized protein n=1 Tax=Sphaerisporangium flaviroseum TaxID=509199 RepID=A0ABP7JFP1_9ACTN